MKEHDTSTVPRRLVKMPTEAEEPPGGGASVPGQCPCGRPLQEHHPLWFPGRLEGPQTRSVFGNSTGLMLPVSNKSQLSLHIFKVNFHKKHSSNSPCSSASCSPPNITYSIKSSKVTKHFLPRRGDKCAHRPSVKHP